MIRPLLCALSLLALACAHQPQGSASSDSLERGSDSLERGLASGQDMFGWFSLEASFRAAQGDFTRSLQEGRLDDAVAFVDPSMREAFRGLETDLDEARLTHFEIGDVRVARLTGEATAVVRFSGPVAGEPLEVTQHWRLDRARDRWYVRPEIDRLRGIALAARPTSLAPAALAD